MFQVIVSGEWSRNISAFLEFHRLQLPAESIIDRNGRHGRRVGEGGGGKYQFVSN